MELNGELRDFPLTDILQILSLSRKTGTLIVRSKQGARGIVVFLCGKMVQATINSSALSLGQILMQQGLIDRAKLDRAIKLQSLMVKPLPVGAILVQQGVMEQSVLMEAVRQQIQNSVNEMLKWQRGTFEVRLNAIPIGRGLPYVMLDYIHTIGFSMEEVLLEAARSTDESNQTLRSLAPGFDTAGLATLQDSAKPTAPGQQTPAKTMAPVSPPSAQRTAKSPYDDAGLVHNLKTFLDELNQIGIAFDGEITLLVMRVASEICSRGVLLLVRDEDLIGLGQFGILATDVTPDKWVRGLSIPLEGPSILSRAVHTRQAQLARLDYSTNDIYLPKAIGGLGLDLTAFAIPMIIEGGPRIVIYGDNFPGNRPLGNTSALEIFVAHAALMIEKLLLEQKIKDLSRA